LSGTRGEFGQLRIEAEELHRELAGTRRQAAEKAQHPLDPCVEGSHAYGTMRRRREPLVTGRIE
jgi:hypothetical protein